MLRPSPSTSFSSVFPLHPLFPRLPQMPLLASPSLLRRHFHHLSRADLTIHRRLDEIQSSSTRHMGENRNVLARLMDAEHVAKQLEGVWADIQLAYNEFIVHLSVFDYDAEADGLT
jgi:hypothetical protein